MATTVSQILLALGLVLGILTHLSGYLVGNFLLLFLLLSTICSALIYPTENKLLPLLASGSKLLHVNGLFQLSYQALDLVLNGAVLGLLSVLSVKTTLALAVPVFGIALLAFRALKITSSDTSDHSDTNYRQALWTGWQTLRRHPFMLRALIPFAALNFFYGAVDTSLPRLSKVYLSGQAWGVRCPAHRDVYRRPFRGISRSKTNDYRQKAYPIRRSLHASQWRMSTGFISQSKSLLYGRYPLAQFVLD